MTLSDEFKGKFTVFGLICLMTHLLEHSAKTVRGESAQFRQIRRRQEATYRHISFRVMLLDSKKRGEASGSRDMHAATIFRDSLIIIDDQTVQWWQTVLRLPLLLFWRDRGGKRSRRSSNRLRIGSLSESIRRIRFFPEDRRRFRLLIVFRQDGRSEAWVLLMHDFDMNLFFDRVKDVFSFHVFLVRQELVRRFEC